MIDKVEIRVTLSPTDLRHPPGVLDPSSGIEGLAALDSIT